MLGSIWQKIKPHYFWVAVGTGLLLILVAIFTELKFGASIISTASLNLGVAVIGSGVFASILKSLQFTGLFQEELEKAFNSQAFSSLLQDVFINGHTTGNPLNRILEKNVRQHFGELQGKFPTSVERFLNAHYNYYFNSYQRTITIKSFTRATGQIDIEDDFRFNIVSKKKTDFTSNLGGLANSGKHNLALFTVKEGDGAHVDKTSEVEKANSNFIFKIPLKKDTTYQVRRRILQTFKLCHDPIVLQQFRTVCNDLTLKIVNHVPSEISVDITFLNFEKQFPCEEDVRQNVREDSYHINDLTFPHQGYIVNFVPLT